MLEGCIQGIEDNWFQGRIADSAYELERAFNEGRRTIVGVNRFTEGNEDSAIEILQITNEDEARQLKRLEQVREQRDQAAVDAALERLRTDAADPEVNLMPTLIDAVEPVRHPRRSDERPRRRLRPPHRSPHDLALVPSECLRVVRVLRAPGKPGTRHSDRRCVQPAGGGVTLDRHRPEGIDRLEEDMLWLTSRPTRCAGSPTITA